MKKDIHYIHPYLVNPSQPINVFVIGAGGTGSQLLQRLARVHIALKAFDHPGIQVTVFDDDIVSEANIGRQLFPLSDIGISKARSIVYRINRFYNLNWDYREERFHNSAFKSYSNGEVNIIFSCVDSIKSRSAIVKKANPSTRIFERDQSNYDAELFLYYIIDIGNSESFGQVIMHNYMIFDDSELPKNHLEKLSSFFDIYPNVKDKKLRGPSCSLAEALKTQDLFINSTMAEHAAHLFYKMIRIGYTNYNVIYSNLNQMSIATVLK